MSKRLKERDMKLWENWKKHGGEKEGFDPLFNAMKPLAQRAITPYTGTVDIPPATLENRAYEGMIHGLRSFDPAHASGAQLSTHVTNKVNHHVRRFVHEHRGSGHRIPENRGFSRIPEFNAAKDELEMTHGYEPSLDQIHQHLQSVDKQFWTRPEVERMHGDMLRSAPGVGETIEENVSMRNTKEQSAINEVKFQISGEMDPKRRALLQQVFDGVIAGQTGQQIAQRVGASEGRVSSVRKELTGMLDKEIQRRR